MKKILLSIILGAMTAILSSSSAQPETKSASTFLLSTENANVALYEKVIKANIIATTSDPETGFGNDPSIVYKNARNQYCSEPVGKMGCVRAIGKKCTLGVYCISPKDNL